MIRRGGANGQKTKKGRFIMMANAIADAIEEAVPVIMKQVEDAKERRREQEAEEKIDRFRCIARERAETLQRARQAAKQDLRSTIKAWREAFAIEAACDPRSSSCTGCLKRGIISISTSW